jgi:hypothetical protein
MILAIIVTAISCATPGSEYTVRGACASGAAEGPYELVLNSGITQVTGQFSSGLKVGVFTFLRSTGGKIAERRKLFRLWHRFREGALTREELQLASRPVRRQILSLLEEGTELSNVKVRGMCRQMLKLQAAFFTFIDIDRVEPTNNAAERAIRFAVLMRKVSFGSDSERGSRFVERFFTARATLRGQRRDLYSFLKDACSAALLGTQAPSLLPVHARMDQQATTAA